MSNLSTAECTAGISRTALATTLKKNGTNGDTPHEPKVPKVTTAEYISGYRETAVIATPMRKLSVLEAASGEIVLRDASFIGNKCDLALIHLEHEQAHALAEVLARIEARDAGDPARLETRRVRA